MSDNKSKTPEVIANTVQLGDIVIRYPITFSNLPDAKRAGPMKGRVVYIHPKGRFHVVEFGEGRCAVREGFWGIAKTQNAWDFEESCSTLAEGRKT